MFKAKDFKVKGGFGSVLAEAVGNPVTSINEAAVSKNISGIGKVTIDQHEARLSGVKDLKDAVKKAPEFARFIDNDKRYKKYEAKDDGEWGIAIYRDGQEEYHLQFEDGDLLFEDLFLERSDVKHFKIHGELPPQ